MIETRHSLTVSCHATLCKALCHFNRCIFAFVAVGAPVNTACLIVSRVGLDQITSGQLSRAASHCSLLMAAGQFVGDCTARHPYNLIPKPGPLVLDPRKLNPTSCSRKSTRCELSSLAAT